MAEHATLCILPDTDRRQAAALLPAARDDALDRFAALVEHLVDVPIALVSVVDDERQMLPGQAGLPEPVRTAALHRRAGRGTRAADRRRKFASTPTRRSGAALTVAGVLRCAPCSTGTTWTLPSGWWTTGRRASRNAPPRRASCPPGWPA
jgi:hypothetical protein